MGHTDEPKMDELKRLLRRLDGLDASKGVDRSAQQAEADQRGYVGALRGAPVHGEQHPVAAAPPTDPSKSSSKAIVIAAMMAAALSTATVYFIMSSQKDPGSLGAGPVPSSERVVPSKLEFKPPEVSGPGQTSPSETADVLLRRAERYLEGGDIEGARLLLRQAAELGSGAAALRLGRSYDPKQTGALRYADSQTNPALAKAWYERALALGTREAASFISDPGAR